MSKTHCPLCFGTTSALFHSDQHRDYYRCRGCLFVFVPPDLHLSLQAEKAIYDLHQNQLDDPGYRHFLSRLSSPLLDRLSTTAEGLDYGCGPSPLLAQMLAEHGHKVALYDPLYAHFPEHLNRRYDFISCSEVIEHFRHPAEEFQRLFGLLKPNGLLGLMTKRVIDAEAFARWHYKNDLTHVGFFSEATLRWLAETYRCRVDFVAKDVAILQRDGDK